MKNNEVLSAKMKLREGGKEHQADNRRCPACDQKAPNGIPLSGAEPNRHYPYVDTSGNPPCGGLVHAEVFPEPHGGCTVLYRCDKCGGAH